MAGNRAALESVQIAVFAKAPLPGLAKTRLIPALGA
ncbi:MAG: glycosyltransferase, partial [Betaproteobacteria bacterium]